MSTSIIQFKVPTTSYLQRGIEDGLNGCQMGAVYGSRTDVNRLVPNILVVLDVSVHPAMLWFSCKFCP